MSLNFDLTKVRERLGEERWDLITTSYETRGKPDGNQQWHPVTDALIWATMMVDLGSITEKNIDEWCFRMGLILKLTGKAHLVGSLGSYFISRADIENHIGLKTNVTTKSRSAFLTKIFGHNSSDEKACMAAMVHEKSAFDCIEADLTEYYKAQETA